MREATAAPAGLRWHTLRLSSTMTTALFVALLSSWNLWISAMHDFGMADESWFLQVLARVVSGDAPYRDVFWGTTPLAIYVTAPLVAVFGVEILVVKAVVAVCLALSTALTLRIGRQLGLGRRSLALLLLALLAYTWPRPAAAYTPLAILGLLACGSAVLHWRAAAGEGRRGGTAALAWAGCWAGFAFAAKQNIGVDAGVLLAGVVAVTLLEHRLPPSRLVPAMAASATAGGLVIAVAILPIGAWGGWERFVDYGFANKTTYLDVGRLPYTFELRELPHDLRTMRSLSELVRNYGRTMFLVPPFAVIALLTTMVWVRGRRGTAVIVLGLLGAGMLTAYPRFDSEHLVYAMPTVLLALVWSGRQLAPRMPRYLAYAARNAAVLWWGCGLAVIGISALHHGLSPRYERSTLPHFRGVMVESRELATLNRYAAQLQRIAAKAQQPFLLTPYAGFFYLVGGLDNPTPFDYPLVTAFGRSGRAELMAAIEDEQLKQVCMNTIPNYVMSPTDLERFVAAEMQPGRRFPFCTMYRR